MFTANALADDEINKITHENAMQLYHFNPFQDVPKEQATVGALRKSVDGHDVSIRALSQHEKSETTFADFTANAKAVSGATE